MYNSFQQGIKRRDYFKQLSKLDETSMYSDSSVITSKRSSLLTQKLQMLDQSTDDDFGISKQNNLNVNLEFDFNDSITENPCKLLTCRYNPDCSMAAVGSEEGFIRVIKDNKIVHYLFDKEECGKPVTCVRWRPQNPQKLDNTLLATYADGKVVYWQVTTKKELFSFKEDGNFINSCDYSLDGTKFVTAGSDGNIRLYDASRSNQQASIFSGTEKLPKHTNRIFSLQFHSNDPNVLYSGGWDNIVMKWDVRRRIPIDYIYGPTICGDALHQEGNEILTGSWRTDNQIEVWDDKTLKKKYSIPWKNVVDQKSMIYSCVYDKTGRYILAGSSGSVSSEIRIFERKQGGECLETFNNFKGGAFSIDSTKKQQMLFATAQGQLIQLDYSSL